MGGSPAIIVSGSRDKSAIVWRINQSQDQQIEYARPERSLLGHSHFVQDVVLSNDSNYALTASWDGTLRLWNLKTGETTNSFIDHEKDVLSVAFSPLNHKIISGSRDKTIRLWNVLGECKLTVRDGAHTDWVSCVRYSPKPEPENELVVSGGWDNVVKVWDKDFNLVHNLVGHTGYVSTVTVSPDGSLCASGGRDGLAKLWDLNDGKHLYDLAAGATIHSLVFSPTRYWLCAATDREIIVWDLETKDVVERLEPEWEERSRKALKPYCLCLCWSADGNTLYSGYTDNKIRVWTVPPPAGGM